MKLLKHQNYTQEKIHFELMQNAQFYYKIEKPIVIAPTIAQYIAK